MAKNERTWTVYGSIIDENEIWYVNYRGTLLCCYSLIEKRMKKVEVIPYRGTRSEALYSNIIKKDSTLVLIPANAYEVCLYDMDTGTFEKLPLNLPSASFNTFCGGAVWKDSIYFFPRNYRYIVKLNLKGKHAGRVCDLQSIVRMEPDREAFQYNSVQNGHAVFFLSALENKILCFDMDAERVIAKAVGEADAVFSALSLMKDGRFAAIDQKGRIYIISGDLESWETYDRKIGSSLSGGTEENAKSYADCICMDHSVFFFPANADALLKYRVDEKSVECITIDEEDKSDYSEAIWARNIKFSLLHIWNNRICGFYTRTGKFFLFNPDNNQMEFYEADSNLGEIASERIMRQMLRQGVVVECNHSYDSLARFLKIIQKL